LIFADGDPEALIVGTSDLLSSNSTLLGVYSVEKGVLISSLGSTSHSYRCVDYWSAPKNLLAVGGRKDAFVFDIRTPNPVMVLRGHTG